MYYIILYYIILYISIYTYIYDICIYIHIYVYISQLWGFGDGLASWPGPLLMEWPAMRGSVSLASLAWPGWLMAGWAWRGMAASSGVVQNSLPCWWMPSVSPLDVLWFF